MNTLSRSALSSAMTTRSSSTHGCRIAIVVRSCFEKEWASATRDVGQHALCRRRAPDKLATVQNHVAGQLRSVSRARTVQILCRLVGECDKIDITAASTPARIGAKLVVERVGLVGGEPVLATKHVRRMNLTQVLTESGSAVPLTHADVPCERMQLLLAVGKRALQEW